MGKKGGNTQKVFDYLLSLQYGVCHGPVDAIYRLRVGGKIAWLGTVETTRSLKLDDYEIFGGDQGQGGIYGDVDITLGAWDESQSTILAARLDRPVGEIPAYRGLATLFFRGTQGVNLADPENPVFSAGSYIANSYGGSYDSESAGFWWGQNITTIPAVDVTVGYSPAGPTGGADWRVIWPDDADKTHDSGISGEDYAENEESPVYPGENGLTKLPGANPAYMIYEAIISEDYGSGVDAAGINDGSFLLVAERLHAEKFGLSMIWTGQMKVEDFVQDVLNTIRGFLFVDPENGLWTLRLLRPDIQYAANVSISPANADVRNRKRMLWGETANRVIVQYTDPTTEDRLTVEALNLANIAIQDGRVRPETKAYHAVRWANLAQSLADRDLAELSLALFSGQVRGSREFSSVKPGDTMELAWPEDGIAFMKVRVMKVRPGGADDPEVRFDIVEDMFSTDQNAFVAPQGSLAEPTTQLPAPLTVQIPVTIPLPVLMALNGSTVALVDDLWPSIAIGFILDNPSQGVDDVRVHGPVPQPDGSSLQQRLVTVDTFASRQTSEELVMEVFSTLPESLTQVLGFSSTDAGATLMLGDDDETAELVMLYTYAAGVWTILRGLYDTEPGLWPVGTRISAFPDFLEDFDPGDRVAGVSVNYRFQPRVSGRLLAMSAVPTVSFTPTDRPILPFRPANVQLDGNGFDGVDYSSLATLPSTFEVTWANRNRGREDQMPVAWNAASVTHESGTTTSVRIIGPAEAVVFEQVGLTGESLTLDFADFGLTREGWIEVLTVRDGHESRVKPRRAFTFLNKGWGNGWGFSWGGVP